MAWLLVVSTLFGAALNTPAFQRHRETTTIFCQPPPGGEPVPFLPDVLSNTGGPHGKIALSPDGAELYWSVQTESEPHGVIYRVICRDGEVSGPTQVFRDCEYRNQGPALCTDSRRMFFVSRRPHPSSTTVPVNGIWYAEKTDSVWSEPMPVHVTFDSSFSVGHPTVSRSGNLFFPLRKADERYPRLGRCELVDGEYRPPEPLEGALAEAAVIDPFIDPDERFVLFASPFAADSRGGSDLYVSFHNSDGSWGAPINLDGNISTSHFERFPSLSPNGKYLFFLRAVGTSLASDPHYYWVSTEILDSLLPR